MSTTPEVTSQGRQEDSAAVAHAPRVQAPTQRVAWTGHREWLAHFARLSFVAAGYIVAGKLGLQLASVHPSATAIWPCTGIALAALLVFGARMWPAVLVGALVVNLTTAGSLASSLGIAAGNTLEAVIGAGLVRRYSGGRAAFERPRTTFMYAGLVALACMVSATFGVASLALTGFAPWAGSPAIWLTWWLGDVGGALVVAPFLIAWSAPRQVPLRWDRVPEAAGVLASVAFVGWAVFRWADPLAVGISLKFFSVPTLLWAAFRFGQRVSTLSLVLLAGLAVSGTLGRLGSSQPWELNGALVILQVFLGVMAATTLSVTAVVGERRRAAEAERATSEQLREAVTQLEAFSHAISHDLRTPIGTVQNYAAVLEEDVGPRLGAEDLRRLRHIQTASESATRLLDQLALYAWRGPRLAEREVVDMNALAREAYAEVTCSGHDMTDVRFELADLPPAVANAALLVRVLRNLISNAVKFTRGREPRRVDITGWSGRGENTYVVSDNGIGFDPAEAKAMFEPFRRLSGAYGFEGIGVGLAVVAKIIDRHGGRVWAESDGATGARFYFTLSNEGVRR